MLEEDVRMLKFIKAILYTKKGIWMSVRLSRPMKGNLQVVLGKADGQESIITAKREVREKMDFSVTKFQWLVNDNQYDYDIYLCDIEKFKP